MLCAACTASYAGSKWSCRLAICQVWALLLLAALWQCKLTALQAAAARACGVAGVDEDYHARGAGSRHGALQPVQVGVPGGIVAAPKHHIIGATRHLRQHNQVHNVQWDVRVETYLLVCSQCSCWRCTTAYSKRSCRTVLSSN